MTTSTSGVEINGVSANLEELSETIAVIKGAVQPQHLGAVCDFTLFADLLGRRVPVQLKGEVVRCDGDTLEISFAAPTRNWHRIVHVLNELKARRGLLH